MNLFTDLQETKTVKVISYAYAVVEVAKGNDIRITKTKKHSKMMKAVKAAISRQNPYTVIRKAIKCTTV